MSCGVFGKTFKPSRCDQKCVDREVVIWLEAMESPAHRRESLSSTRCPMSGINGIGNNSPVQKVVSNPVQRQIPADAARQLGATDKVELSGMSHRRKTLKANDVRTEKVAAIKAQIEAGTYEDDAKMDAAV